MASNRLRAGNRLHVFPPDFLEKFRILQILKQQVRIL